MKCQVLGEQQEGSVASARADANAGTAAGPALFSKLYTLQQELLEALQKNSVFEYSLNERITLSRIWKCFKARI